MGQTTFSIRMDEDIKKEFDSLCQIFGMSVSTAFNIFARTVVREKRIPFEISFKETTSEGAIKAFNSLREEAKANGISDMPIDEINEEIESVRKGDK